MKRLFLLGGFLAVSLAFAGPATAMVIGVDQLVVYKNGNLLFNDTFDDGAQPPSAPNFSGGSSASYFEYGAVTEAGGRALLHGQNPGGTQGLLVVGNSVTSGGMTIFNNDLLRVSGLRLLTNADSNNLAAGLKSDDDIVTMALFDLQPASTLSSNYGLTMLDLSGSGGNGNDVVRAHVLRGTTTGDQRVQGWRADFSQNPTVISESQGVSANLGNAQILFRQSSAAGSNLMHAEFAYVNAPNFDVTNQAAVSALTFQSLGSRSVFNGEAFTRVELRLLERVASANFATMTTGSPTSLTQTVSTGATPFDMTFNYRFETPTGTLEVILDGSVIATYIATGALSGDFTAASILVDNPLLNLSNVDLEFRVTNPTSDPSSVSLDSIYFPGLVNGDFGDSTNGWQITATDPANVAVTTLINQAPLDTVEPSAVALVGIGLAGVFAVSWRRRRGAA